MKIMARTVKRTTSSVMWLCYFIVLSCVFVGAVNANSGNSSGVVSSELTDEEIRSTVEKGMKPFFDMVKSFLGIVQPERLTEQSWLNLSDIYVNGEINTDQFTDWQDWVTYLIGFVICAAVGVLFFIVMPITGCIFCCCRCCGKCGGRPKAHDPKRAGCKRKSYCTLLLLLNTVTLAGVVCAFMSNEIVYDKLRNNDDSGPIGKLTATLDHVDSFTNSTLEEIESTLLTNFVTTKDRIISDIQNTANNAVDDVLRQLNATSLLSQTNSLSQVVNKTRDELSNVATHLSRLSLYGTWLAGNLTDIKISVLVACKNLPGGTDCIDVDQYTIEANFTNLDALSAEAENVSKAVDLSQHISEAEKRVDETKNQTTQSVDTGIQNATTSVNDVQTQIEDGIQQVKTELKSSVLDSTASLKSDFQNNQEYLTKYGKYWWYGGLGISCVLLLVVVLYYVGVLFGLCGERPGLGAQCCNTGTGANFLMAGVGFTFLLAWIIMLVCVVLFLVGGPLYTELCRYFYKHNPQDLKPFNDAVMEAADLEKRFYNGKNIQLNLVEILDDCRRDQPIYSVLKLENMVNLTQYTDISVLREALDSLKTNSFSIPNITIVNDELRRSLTDFATAGLDGIPFDNYYSEINKNLTVGNLPLLASNLRNLANQGNASPEFSAQMEDLANQLLNLQKTLVADMEREVDALNRSLSYLQNLVSTQIGKATNDLLDGLEQAQDNFNIVKENLVKKQLGIVIDNVIATTENFIQTILTKVNEEIGRCRPIYDGFYSATDAVCVVVLDPLNGFWFSLGWCLFFLVPCLIFAVKLAGLYRREHDEKDFDDPNYMLYGGHHQDTIPLTSVDRGQRSAYAAPSGGMSNSAYHRDSYTGPVDKYAPPPYGVPANGMGSAAMNGRRGGGERNGQRYLY